METILWIVIFVLVGVIILGVKFVGFKSKLINELGRRGIEHNLADNLYSIWAGKINALHHDGASASTIADIICSSVQINQFEGGGKPHTAQVADPSLEYETYEDWLEVYKVECDVANADTAAFVDFVDQAPLRLAFEHKQDPKRIAALWAKDFDPIAMFENTPRR